MDTNDFTAQLNQAIQPGIQRVLGLTIEDTEAGAQAVFLVGNESWQLTHEAQTQRWQLHTPATGVPIWFSADELMQSLLVLRAYRLSQLDYTARTTVQAQLTATALTLRGEDGQEIALSPKAALELLDLLIVSEPELKQILRDR